MKISWRRAWILLLLAGGISGLVGCSSGSDPSVPAPPADAAPEALRTTPAAVAAGMRAIDQIGRGIATSAGTDKARAQSLAGQIEPAWQPIEGTVKQNDQTAYLAMEDAFAVLENGANSGDATSAAKGADSVSTTVRDYLAKYPG
jgi:hypothetical protein